MIKWHLFLSLGMYLCSCMATCVCMCMCVCAFYLMTNRMEGSEQSGWNDYYGNKGGKLMEGGKKRQQTDQRICTHQHKTGSITCLLISFSFILSFYLFFYGLFIYSIHVCDINTSISLCFSTSCLFPPLPPFYSFPLVPSNIFNILFSVCASVIVLLMNFFFYNFFIFW